MNGFNCPKNMLHHGCVLYKNCHNQCHKQPTKALIAITLYFIVFFILEINKMSVNLHIHFLAKTLTDMNTRKITLILLLLGLILPETWAQQAKRVYITLDVSNSMCGNKYAMGNYTAQFISVFAGASDQVTIYYLGQCHDLSHKGDYTKLHRRFEQLPATKLNYHEVRDLLLFMDAYRSDPNYQDWLFIVGDGNWDWKGALGDYTCATGRFGQFIKDNNIHVCYLQTGDQLSEENPFTTYLSSLALPGVEIRRSDTTMASVRDNAVYFANKILGFSDEHIDIKESSTPTEVEFVTDFPLVGFLLLYQGGDAKITAATCGGKQLPYTLKGNPTTRPLMNSGGMEGVVWDFHHSVPAGQTVTLAFNHQPMIGGLCVYPQVDLRMLITPLGANGLPLENIGQNLFRANGAEKQVTVAVNLTDSHSNSFTSEQMKRVIVQLTDGSHTYNSTYHAADSSFRITLPLTTDTVSFRANASAKGYFAIESELQSVVRMPMLTLSEQVFSSISYSLLEGGLSHGGVINDSLLRCNYSFDTMYCIDLATNDTLACRLLGDSIVLDLPAVQRCECNYPDSLHYTVLLLSRDGINVGGKPCGGIEIPVAVPVARRSFIVRCRSELTQCLVLILISIYIILLQRKHRFGKTARITPSYINLDDEWKVQGGTPLRKRGIGPWIGRWLLPSHEKRRISIRKPQVDIKVIASESPNKIFMPSRCYDATKMSIPGVNDSNVPKQIRLNNNTTINIQNRNGNEEGKLVFSVGKKDDIAAYRLMLGFIIAGLWLAIGYIVITHII